MSVKPDIIYIATYRPSTWDRIVHFFKRSERKTEGFEMKKAFTIGGRTFYAVDDLHNKPYQRALTAIDYYEELSMRTTRELLLLHCKAVLDILNGGDNKKVELTKLADLTMKLQRRTEWILTPDLIYKLSSVVFVDLERESPLRYDFAIAKEKIEFWKKHTGAADFFLQKPLRTLLPFLDHCEINFQSYSKVVQELQRGHLTSILSGVSAGTRSQDSVRELISAVETQIALGDSAGSPSSNIS